MSITDRFLAFSLLGAEWVMWVLLVLSLISVAIIVERVIFFFGERPEISGYLKEIRELLANEDAGAALDRSKRQKGIAAHVANAALAEAKFGPDSASEAAASAMVREKMRMERNLAFLGTVGNNAPFIGLFGTVIGIVQAFNHLSLNAQGGAAAVMAGISEALVATALGLLVAVPAVIAFNIFQRRIKAIMGDADAVVHMVLAGLKGQSRSAKE